MGDTSITKEPLMMSTPNDSAVDMGYIEDKAPDDSIDEIKHFKAAMKKMNGGDMTIEIDNVDSGSKSSETVSSDSGTSSFLSSVSKHGAKMEKFVTDNQSSVRKVMIGLFCFLYLAYFITALIFGATKDCVNTVPLICLTCIVLAFVVLHYIWTHFGEDVKVKCFRPCLESIENKKTKNVLKWLFVLIVIGSFLSVIISTVINQPSNLISVAGFVFFVILLFIFSEHRSQIKWRPILGGFTLQFMFAVFILKWDLGYKIFHFLGQQVQVFLSYTDVGSRMVFGDKFMDHFFAMKVLPVVIFFSCFISVLYHLGIMQMIIGKIAFVMRLMLGTTAAESLCAAGNIFVGQTEAPILIRPFLEKMTKSELHAVMTGGFATIAGGVLAAYVSFGVPAEHLLCASVMNAPCALAVSKLLFPETEKSKISKKTHIDNQSSNYRNVLEAAAAGASASIGLVANIAANLIAFLALLAFVNAVLSWFGGFVCFPDLSFEWICSYVFMPVAFLMGVEWKDARIVGELIGIKTFLNEFVAYEQLSQFINTRRDCADGIILSPKSEIIATYALCGFANLSSIGIQLGGLTPMAPNRASDLASVVLKALFGGIVACLMTASIAGLLIVHVPDDMSSCIDMNSTTMVTNSSLLFNTTEPSNILYTILTNTTLSS
ncbi:hypothetical protein SNE40_023541 [Patella caerulea]|uniref:Sodium/nucleoside cotransporter n=1 Tax=Patella caerulea TaxID=87958 RepID=A0AAN8GC60_PATCE